MNLLTGSTENALLISVITALAEGRGVRHLVYNVATQRETLLFSVVIAVAERLSTDSYPNC